MEKDRYDDPAGSNKALDSRQRKAVLDELKNISGMLDDSAESAPAFDDLPVLKSFVDPAHVARQQPSVAGTTQGTRPQQDATSRQYQQLRQRASLMVNDIVSATLPRLEAELRARLDAEVDRILKQKL